MSRRGFLRIGALGAGALALTAAGTETEAGMADTRQASSIDAHVHVWPLATPSYPPAPGYEKGRMALASFTPAACARLCG